MKILRNARPSRLLPGLALFMGLLPVLAMGLLLSPRPVAAGEPEASAEVRKLYERMACGDCHGMDGRTPLYDTIPIIAGQMPRYSYLVLIAYKTGERQGVGAKQHTDVNDLASDEQLRLLADYIATLK